MSELALFLGRVITCATLGFTLRITYRAWLGHRLDLDYLWVVGVAVSAVFMFWVQGPLLWLCWICYGGCVLGFTISMVRLDLAMKRRSDRIQAEILRIINEGQDGVFRQTLDTSLTLETERGTNENHEANGEDPRPPETGQAPAD